MKTVGHTIPNQENHWVTFVFFSLACLQSFFGPLDIADSATKLSVGLNGVVFIKLAIAGLVGIASAWGICFYPSARQAVCSVPAAFLFAMLFLTLAGGLNGVTAAAVPSSIINTANVLFVVVALTVLGFRRYCLAILLGILFTAAIGLALYYVVPSRGVFLEPIADGEFLERLGGMAHPNSVARSVIIGGLIAASFALRKELSWALSVGLLMLFGWNAILTKSRTAIAGGIFGGIALMADNLRSRTGVVLIGVGIILAISSVFYLFATGNEARLVDRVVGLVSKSGDTSELTSGTGRTDIWMEALRHIAIRPLLGYGLNAGPVLLIDHSQATHNAILHATMSGGLIAGVIMIGLQLWTLWLAFYSPNLLVRSLCVFMVISCLTEDTVLETFPGPCTLVWFACCLLPTLPSMGTDADESSSPQET
jgi:exopolysaccharide production protein ExoQ